MKQQITISGSSISKTNGQKINVNPWIIVKSTGKKNKLVYPPVIMPHENHGYLKAKRFDFF